MDEAPTPGQVADLFDARASDYDESAFHRALAARAVAFAGIDGVRSVLDVATGTGLVLRALPEDGPLRLAGVDVSEGMLRVAARHLPDAELVRADATAALPFPEGAFDLITCVTALHLMSYPAAALAGWRGLLAPGGRIVVAAFRTGDLEDVPAIAAALHAGAERRPHGSHARLHERTGTVSRLAEVAAAAGYALTRSETWVFPEPQEPSGPPASSDAPGPASAPPSVPEACLLVELTPLG